MMNVSPFTRSVTVRFGSLQPPLVSAETTTPADTVTPTLPDMETTTVPVTTIGETTPSDLHESERVCRFNGVIRER